MFYKILCGDSAEVLKDFEDNTFDSVVTDPPYGIEFLHKDWDTNSGAIELWKEVYRVMKPGAHLLAFSAARTYHRLVSNLENVGFEIRDQIMWLYATGFPKGQNIGKKIQKKHRLSDWEGWHTALKPAHEPIVMVRKPPISTTVENVRVQGVGALNIDGCRIPDPENANLRRFPTNVIGEIYGYQKYFYCPKPSGKERSLGLATPPKGPARPHKGAIYANDNSSPMKARDNQFGRIDNLDGSRSAKSNSHPTVKPIDLMAYLVRLVTPPNGKVLDPFSGSGTTGLGCILEGADYIGIELDPEYVAISNARLAELMKGKK